MPDEAGTLGFIAENDIVAGNDRFYTSGLMVHWTSGVGTEQPAWASVVGERLPWLSREGAFRHSYSFGQSIFTPRDIASSDPPADDRPYAGWLYGSIQLSTESDRQLDLLSLTLGVVGPAALAEQSQRLAHKLIFGSEAQGWDTQLDNEPGMVLAWQRAWRKPPVRFRPDAEWDLTPHTELAVGNVFTHASGGATLRIGQVLPPDYGPVRIQPGASGSGSFTAPPEFRWHALAGFEVRAVARNIFLDGNSFRDSRSVDKDSLVADFHFGIVLDWPGMRVSYSHVFRSREFKTQRGQSHFGSLGWLLKF